MYSMIFVALGGALGSVARFKLSGWVLHSTIDWRFPLGTFIVNVTGCLVLGVLAGLAEKHDLFSGDARTFLFTGIVGGFTTFSAFGLETLFLLRRNEILIASLYISLSILIGLLLMWIGLILVPERST